MDDDNTDGVGKEIETMLGLCETELTQLLGIMLVHSNAIRN